MKILTHKLSPAMQQGMLYGASIALMKGTSLLMLPFIANHITADQFGRLEVISTLAVIGSILVGMGLEDTLFRFAGTEKCTHKRAKISAEIFTLTLLIGLLTLLVSWFVAPLLSPVFPGGATVYELRLVLSVLALEGCIAIPLGWLRMNNHAFSFFFASTARALLQAFLVVVFLYFERGVSGILEASLIATVAQMLFLTVLQLRDTGIRFNIATCKRAFIYSLPIVASGLVAFALNGMDRWVLAEQTSLADVAQFAIAAKFALAMVLLMQPFGMWWSPRRFSVLNTENGKQKVSHYIAIGCVIALLITVSVAIISPPLITTLLPASYQQATYYVVAITIIMLLKELVELFNIGCFNGETTSSQLIINLIGAIVGMTSMLYLAPIYQVWGVILALLLAQSLRLLMFYYVSQYFLTLNYPIRALLSLSIASALWLIVASQIQNLAQGLGQSIILLIVATSSLLWFAQRLGLINLNHTMLTRVTQ
ncbi:oligosaccharide translocase [Psychromonas sp. psych-6C06]|uniref:lipopolysaccharide biosynthesis protein n=1 Tax=Psychromonas sp. psych-6C06 TaxID=2058089 RepID=UPI000C32A307|nr:oligosaccharide flippase family protein [Psychromonas sp. psych-6C06]PKF62471.1 oligosaccharide translocase [Psychromonas sp. psych-6C06]